MDDARYEQILRQMQEEGRKASSSTDDGLRDRQEEMLRERERMVSNKEMGMESPSSRPIPIPTPQPASQPIQQSQPIPQPQPQATRASAQQEMRARMQASRNQAQSAGQPVVMQQTESYQPTQQGGTPNTAQQVNTQMASSTVINTTQTDDGKSGFKLSKKLILCIAGIVAVTVVFGFVLLSSGGSKVKEEEEETTEELVWLDPVETVGFLYTPEEITALRAAGYTGNEIEDYQKMEMPAEDLIKVAEESRDAWVEEAIAPLYDTASDEYKKHVSQTWLSLPQRTDMDEWTMLAGYYTERKNLDYEKIDVYGNQLFIKIYLDDNEHENWFFACVTPEEYNKLKDSGNVIVTYTYCTRLVGEDYFSSVEDKDNIFIVSSSLEIIE